MRQFMYIGVTTFIGAFTFFLCSLVVLGNIETLLIRSLICLIVPNILYHIIYKNYNLANESIQWFKMLYLEENCSYKEKMPRHHE